MKTFKRIIASTLSVLMILASLLTVNVFAETVKFPDVADDYTYKSAIYALVDAGIINGIEENGVLNFKPENTITRAEFAKLIAVKLAGNVALTETTAQFPDVAQDYWANPYIAFAVKQGIINGNPDGTFRPFNPVTYGEAIKMIVCAKGYGSLYTPSEPWFAGYIQIANQIDLTKYAQGYGANEAPRGLVAQLIYNMDFCRNITVTQPGGLPSFEDDDEYEEFDGVVEGVYETSLTGQRLGLSKLQVMISGQKFNIGDYNLDKFYDYLGKMVTVRYKESSKNEIISIVESGDNSKITIDASCIEAVYADEIEYYENEESTKKLTAKLSDNLYVIYNGSGVAKEDITDSFIKDKFNIESGEITLMNNDGGKDYEIAYVTSYETYYVSGKSSSDGVYTINDNNNINGSSIVLDEDDCTVQKVSSLGGKMSSSSLSSITSKSVISVAKPYDRTEGTEVIISTIKESSGEVDELDGTDYIKINGKDYSYSNYYRALEDKNSEEYTLEVGDKAAFYFDYAGRLVFMAKSETADDNSYAYILGYDEGSGLGAKCYLRLYAIVGSSGKVIEDAYLDTKVRFNGDDKEASAVGDLLEKKAAELNDKFSGIKNASHAQLIKYKSFTDEVGHTCIDDIETLDPAVDADTFDYKSKAFSKDGKSKFAINSSTIIIQVPDDRADEKKYKKTSFSDGYAYKVEAYDIKNSTAKVVLHYSNSSKTDIYAGNNVAFVAGDVRGAKNDDGVTVDQLTYIYAGNTEIADPLLTEKSGMLSGISKGDLIRMAVDGSEIVKIEKLFVDGKLYGRDGEVSEGNIVQQSDGKGDDEYYYVMYGTVHDVSEGDIKVTPDVVTKHEDYEENWTNFNITSSTKLYKWDSATGKYITDIEPTSLQSVASTANASTASNVIIIRINDTVKAIYIVKQ